MATYVDPSVLTASELKILNTLYRFRAMFHTQYIRWMNIGRVRPIKKNARVDAELKDLTRLGLVQQKKVSYADKQETLLLLTKFGHELISQLTVPHPGLRNQEYADVPYEVFCPLTKSPDFWVLAIKQNEFYLTIEAAGGTPYNSLHTWYTLKQDQEKWEIRFDGKVRIGRYWSLLVMSRGVLSEEEQARKFVEYAAAIRYLDKKGYLLPRSIWVLFKKMPSGFEYSWSTMRRLYIQHMGDLAQYVNLVPVFVDQVNEQLQHELNRSDEESHLVDLLRKQELPVSEAKELRHPFNPRLTYVLDRSDKENTINIFEQFEPFDTVGLSRLIAIVRKLKEERPGVSIVPMLYIVHGKPAPLNFYDYKEEQQLLEWFRSAFWLWIEKDTLQTEPVTLHIPRQDGYIQETKEGHRFFPETDGSG